MKRRLLVKNARLLRGGVWESGSMLAEDGVIVAVGKAPEPADAAVLDAEGALLVPGFLDLHTHGAVGVDVNAADAEGLLRISRFFAAHGVTGWLCSILTDTEEQTLRAIGAARELMDAEKQRRTGGARLLGIHLEGPFLAEAYAGAMPKHLLRTGDIALVRRYQRAAAGAIRSITVAPEVAGVTEIIPALAAEGILVSLGHSNATFAEAMAAVDAGARSITHTFNAMRLFHQHEPALMGAALASDVYCEAILDGDYRLGVNDIVVANGDAMLREKPVRAGSTLTLDRALQNIMAFTGASVGTAAGMLSKNAAALLGQNDLGRIGPGAEASFVLLDERGAVLKTYIRAEQAQTER